MSKSCGNSISSAFSISSVRLIASSESMLWFGDRIRVGRLFSVDRDGGNLQHIRRRTVKEPSQWTVNLDTTLVIDWLVDDPKHILMQLYDELDEAWSVFKVNILGIYSMLMFICTLLKIKIFRQYIFY